MLRTEDLEDQGQLLANVFNLKLLENQEERPVNYMLKTISMWVSGLNSVNFSDTHLALNTSLLKELRLLYVKGNL